MNQDDERRLIVGLLSGPGVGRVQAESLRRALCAVRRENQRRRVIRFIPLLCATLLLAVGLLVWPGRRSEALPSLAGAPAVTAQTVAPSTPPIEPIDDAQLLTLLAGRTVVLLGAPGRERLLVFDAPQQAH